MCLCTSGGVSIPCIYTHARREFSRRLRSLLLYLCYVFRALINALCAIFWMQFGSELSHQGHHVSGLTVFLFEFLCACVLFLFCVFCFVVVFVCLCVFHFSWGGGGGGGTEPE